MPARPAERRLRAIEPDAAPPASGGTVAAVDALAQSAAFIDCQADRVDDEGAARFLRCRAADIRLEVFRRRPPMPGGAA